MNTTTAVPIIRQDGEGEQLWFAGGGVFTMKASAAETGRAFVLLEDRVVRGKTTPLHLHPNEDETIYVLEGEILVHFEGREHRVGQRGLFVAPRGLPHAFMVTSETAHLLCLQTPGTGEDFYRAVSEPVRSSADASRPPDFARLREGAERSESIQLLGPPPFAAAGA
jgi:quercetin dioxygenase-like cupin family protein